jgi:M6 family metalloprotease-like protein
MRIRVITTLTICFALFFPNTMYAANPKAGATCSKQGVSQVFAGKKYTCIKSGKKLVWNKGTAVKTAPSTKSPDSSSKSSEQSSTSAPSTPSETISVKTFDWNRTYSTDDGYVNLYNGPCLKETVIAPQWLDLIKENEYRSICSGIYHLAKYKLGTNRPATPLLSNFVEVDRCRISEPKDSMTIRGFISDWTPERIAWTAKRKVPSSNMTVQVVPIYAEDTSLPVNSPESDYGRFTDFIKNWIEYSSDVGGNVTVRYPENYIKFDGKVSRYGIYHEKNHNDPAHVNFAKDLISQVDEKIDFTNADLAIVVVPAGTAMEKFGQATLPELVTKEGTVNVATTEYPYTPTDLGKIKLSELSLPFWWLHELFHSGIGFADHYGDKSWNPNTEYGMGQWDLMTPQGGDSIAWQKWILGFISDSQINCVNPEKTSIVWNSPSSVSSKEKKLTIIPISRNKGIAIESVRAAGLYYKIPRKSEGVLIYEIDLTIKHHDEGLKLILPPNRSANFGYFFMDRATFQQGESVSTHGFKITVLESGNFGDVVKVEKA